MGVYYPCGVRRLRARLRRGRPRRGALCPPDRPLWSPGPPPRAARACDPEIISPPAWGTPEIAALAWPEPPPGRASWGVLSQNHVRLGLPGRPGSQDRPHGAARACDPEIISLLGGNCPKIAPRAGVPGAAGSQDRLHEAARACDPEIISLRGGNCPKIAPRAGAPGRPEGQDRLLDPFWARCPETAAPGGLFGAFWAPTQARAQPGRPTRAPCA